MSVGGSLVIIPRFLPEPALEAISEHKITVLTAVTTMFGALLDVAENRTPALEFPAMRLAGGGAARSEEHTSELQSLMRISYAVFCLKKKNRYKRKIPRH